jgi:hypothetical protein
VIEQAESLQPAVAWARSHTLPQAPQLSGSLAMWVSHPSVSVVSQFKYPAAQLEIAQAPAVHCGVSCATLQTLPHAPQLIRLVIVSTHVPAPPSTRAHVVSPLGQVQTPFEHVAPIAHR